MGLTTPGCGGLSQGSVLFPGKPAPGLPPHERAMDRATLRTRGQMNGADTTSNTSSSYEIDFCRLSRPSGSGRAVCVPPPLREHAIQLAHRSAQPTVTKGNWRRYAGSLVLPKKRPKRIPGIPLLFHLPHDLADLTVYLGEQSLAAYDILFTPTALHSAAARNCYRDRTKIVEAGWPELVRLLVRQTLSAVASGG